MKPEPLVCKIDCIRLYVSDLEAGLAFYRDKLGHALLWRTPEAVGLRLPGTDAEIVLHTEPIDPEIDLKVKSADAAASRFQEAGGTVVVPPFDIRIGRAAVVRDPWGNQYVLLDTSKGTLVTDDEGNVTGTEQKEGILSRQEYSMVCIAPTVSAILGLPAPAQAIGAPIPEIVDDLAHCDRVAILAPDAFGEYAWRLWQDEMPFLKSLHAQHSIVLRSVLPSITPVNFTTMIAGTDRDGHGVHTFNDDIGCETLYDVVRRAGGTSAGIGLDGYTGAELLARFADIPGNAGQGSDDVIVDKVIEIVDRDRPEFLIAQIGRVDDTFHLYGPSSPQVVPMLRDTDARLKKLVEHLTPLGYGVIILADHGQHDIPDAKEGEKHGSHGTDSDEDCLVPCTWVG